MGARYLERIQAQYDSAPAGRQRAYLSAKRAAYLARMGDFDQARAIVAELRSVGDVYRDPEVSIFLTFVDGLVHFYQDEVDLALDRFTRSSVLSRASGLDDLAAMSSSWLAHLAFGRFDFDCLVSHSLEAFSSVHRGNHDCLARLCLVLGQTLHLASGWRIASTWYSRARFNAVEVGDEATISSIMYNMTVMRIVNYRQALLCSGISDEHAKLAVTGAESTSNFDQLTGVVSLGEFTPILKAQTYSLAERYREAEELYAASLIVSPSKAQARSRCWLLADRSHCLVRLGSVDSAIGVAENAIAKISSDVQPDDLAATHSRLATVFSECGDIARSRFHRDQSIRAWDNFRRLQDGVAAQMSRFDGLYENLPSID